MNEDEGNNRRMMLAALLSLVVVMVWPLVFPPEKPEVTGEETLATSTSTTGTTEKQVGASQGRSDAAPAILKVPAVAEESYPFQGVVKTDDRELPYEVELSNVGGAFVDFRLSSYYERDERNRPTEAPISLADDVRDHSDEDLSFGQMGAVGFGDKTTFSFPTRPVYTVVDQSSDEDRGYIKYLLSTPEGVEVEREYSFSRDSFAVELAVTVRNRSGRAHSHQLWIGSALALNDATRPKSGFLNFAPAADHLETVCFANGSVNRTNISSLSSLEEFGQDVGWVGIDRQYFLAAFVARDVERDDAKCVFERKGDTARSQMILPLVNLGPGEVHRHKFTAYLGIKSPTLLQSVQANLEGAINYTLIGLNLAPLCAALLWVLGLLHDVTASWGLAIIGLTMLVKIVLFPLNQRQGKSMRAMSALKPEMDRIREKYADDNQRQSEEVMRLYREHNVNPASGCLPVLIQLPIGISFFRALGSSVDLYQEEFLWISDLTTPDPLFILPISLAILMFLQQRLTPTAMDPAQQRIMMFTLPLVSGLFMFAMPAGLCVYILVNSVLTIVQQQLINKSMGPPPGAKESVVQGATS